MSELLGPDTDTNFELGETISFDYEDRRLTGKVTRVYDSRTIYHVGVDDNIYVVYVPDDNPQRSSKLTIQG